jgi:hypothetical protein
MRLREAYATLFAQFRILFRIGAANRRRGHRPMAFRQLVREFRRYRAVAARLPRAL